MPVIVDSDMHKYIREYVCSYVRCPEGGGRAGDDGLAKYVGQTCTLTPTIEACVSDIQSHMCTNKCCTNVCTL